MAKPRQDGGVQAEQQNRGDDHPARGKRERKPDGKNERKEDRQKCETGSGLTEVDAIAACACSHRHNQMRIPRTVVGDSDPPIRRILPELFKVDALQLAPRAA